VVLALATGNMEIKEIRQLFLLALAKVESLQEIGVKRRLCKPQDISGLKTEVDKLHTSLDLMIFKASDHFETLSELMRSCGSICCVEVVKPGSIDSFYECGSCPIPMFEEAFL
jgi:hypothetical protein